MTWEYRCVMAVLGLANQNQLRVIMPCEERYNLKNNLQGEVIEPHSQPVICLVDKEDKGRESWAVM